MKVVIVGSGNTATVLGRKIHDGGFQIIQVVSRNVENARLLAEKLNASYHNSLSKITASFDVCLIAVSDHQIASVAGQLPKSGNIVVHTSGSVSIDVLKEVSPHYGVLYPLQTLTKNTETLPPVPVLIDGSSERLKQVLADFAGKWSSTVSFANDEQRLYMHVAAVVANNFTNHLMALTEDFCTKKGISFEMLLPLIRETVNKLGNMSPSVLQTGPAARGDITTIHKHLQLLKDQPALQNLYLALTESIIEYSKKAN